MADVLRLTFVVLALPKAYNAHQSFGWAGVAGWVAACAAPLAHRYGWFVLAGVALFGWAAGAGAMTGASTVLIVLVAMVLGAGVEVDRLLWTQTLAVYLFATANKISPAYFTGSTIEHRFDLLSPRLLAVAGVAVEAWLAWAVYRRHRWAFPVAAALHAGIVATMAAGGVLGTLVLAGFNGAMVLLVWRTTRSVGAVE